VRLRRSVVAGFVKVAEIQDVPAGQRKKVNVGGKHIALFNIEGTYYAIDDTCTHKGGPLLEGEIQGSNLTCPWHGAIFDVKTGEVLRPPAPIGVSRYNVRVVGDDIEIEI